MKKAIELRDFLDFKYLSNITYSPDQKHCAYVMSTCDEIDNSYRRVLYVYDGEMHRQLTSFGKESMFLWKDDTTLLFANMRDEKDKQLVANGEEWTWFYEISILGGEARKAFSIPLCVTSIKILQDERFVITTRYHEHYSSMYQLQDEAKKTLLSEKKAMEDYEVLDELPFYENGSGYTNKIRNALFVYDCNTSELIRISAPFCQISDYILTEDGSALFYVGERYNVKPIYRDTIYKYDFITMQTTTLLDDKQFMIHKIELCKDFLFMMAHTGKQYGLNENNQFYKVDLQNGQAQLFADYDQSIGSTVGSDARYGGGRATKVHKGTLYFISTLRNKSCLLALDQSAQIHVIIEEEGSIDDFDIAGDAITLIAMREHKLQEMYRYTLSENKEVQCSAFNECFYQEKDINNCISCDFDYEGITLSGWILLPREYDEKKTYPAILDIHGGPKTVYGEVYYHEIQLWASMGYVVFFMNPHGADGRGNEFADIRGKYGTIDYEEIMKFTDVVLERYPAIDRNRVGVTGGSYGGFMTNWIIGHTNRFRCAASQRSIANWISFAHTSDIGEIFAEDQQAANTWTNVEKQWWHSPIKYADNCTTPTLFIHSDEDYRCPYSEGMQMYSALCEHGVETRLCMFKGENHELSRSGKPKHRVKRLEEITNWMEKYLK